MRWISVRDWMKSDWDTRGPCRQRHAVKQQEGNSSNLKSRPINIHRAGGSLSLELCANGQTHTYTGKNPAYRAKDKAFCYTVGHCNRVKICKMQTSHILIEEIYTKGWKHSGKRHVIRAERMCVFEQEDLCKLLLICVLGNMEIS